MDLTDKTTNFVHGFKIELRNWNCMKKKITNLETEVGGSSRSDNHYHY